MSTKKSGFPAVTVVPDGAYFDTFTSGANYKILYSDIVTGLGVTGSITQDGAVTGTAILDTQGTVNNIRNIENGSGIYSSVSPDNGVEIKHNFIQDTEGSPVLINPSSASPSIASIVSGDGISASATGTAITISSEQHPYCLLSLQGNTSATVVSVSGDDYLIAGDWTIGLSDGLTGSTTGRVTSLSGDNIPRRITAAASIAPASGSVDVSMSIAVNGVVIPGSKMIYAATSSNPASISIPWITSLSAGDYIELFVSNETNTTNLTVSSAVIRVG